MSVCANVRGCIPGTGKRHDTTGDARLRPRKLQTPAGTVLPEAGPAPPRPATREPVAVPPRSPVRSPAGEAPAGPAPRVGSAPGSAPPPLLWRVGSRRKTGAAGEVHFQTADSVHNRAGRRRMEVGLSAITFYLASTGSPVAATTMDRESGSRAEGGEAGAASGAAAAAAFRESERQVGEAADVAARTQPFLCLVSRSSCPFGMSAFLREGCPPEVNVGVPPQYPRLCSDGGLEKGIPRQPLPWQRRRL